MNNIRKLIFKFLIILLIIIVIIRIDNITKSNKNNTDFQWMAKYIWIENENFIKTNETNKNPNANTWVCFRKNFKIKNKKDIKNVIAKIAVDSKYWLYINGNIVIRDGQLKRGEKENSIYYDEIDISNYLEKGENNISILVWYFGKDSFSHIDSGQGALLFQSQIGNNLIISDQTWKATKNPAFLNDNELQNGRLSEFNIYYNSNLELNNWINKEYDDTNWENAIVCGNYNSNIWGELIKRDIPQFKYSDIKKYINSDEYENKTFEEDTIIEMKLKNNIQLVPYFKIDSKSNEKIIISNNKNLDNTSYYGKVTYITKNGDQQYESPSWINGDEIYYYIPKGIKILELGYRETGYDVEVSGNFECNDSDFNTLWQMANRTLYVNMRDTYMDCPDRERALWIGDASISMEQALYGLDISANKLYEKCIKMFIGWRHEETFGTVSPSFNAKLQLPIQNLLAICSMNNYYKYTGNINFLKYVYPSIKDYLNLWSIGEDGLVSGKGNYFWNIMKWNDSQGETDSSASENIWYYYALKNTYEIACSLNLTEDANEYKNKLQIMYNGFNEKYWDGNGYKSNDFNGYDNRVNAIAILSGIADETKYEKLSYILVNNFDNSVFMEKYILEALCEIGKIEDAQTRIKLRYNEMINNQDLSSTLWEYWDKNFGTKNHAWAGGPLIIMSKYFAGIQPLKEGYSETLLKPEFGILNKLYATVQTVKGKIQIDSNKTEEQINLNISTPTKTLVAIEKISNNYTIEINNIIIYEKGKEKNLKFGDFEKEDSKYLYLYLDPGKYFIISK